MRRVFLVAGLLAILLALAACATSPAPERITVLAAASLTGAFDDVAAAYARARPHQRVTVSYAGSQQLAAQLIGGSRADVVATADERTAADLHARHLVDPPRPLATSRLVIVVRNGNPHRVRGITDLERRDLTVVLAAPEVPAGRYAVAALRAAHVSVRPASYEDSVRGVTGRVALGEADAGIAYSTDVGDRLAAIAIPQAPVARYGVASASERGREFVTFLLGGAGQAVLRRHGFGPPRAAP